ncbi:MAG: YggS family pyridoxal phosphate-dependent enzyme [bacterium]|nr:YggS family pyridoxal phosphate-dependent enzyme [bacterium]
MRPRCRQLDSQPTRHEHAHVPAEPDAAVDRIAAVRAEVAAIARRAGRKADEVGIVAVTKTMPPEVVREALAGGLTDLGENYVQEARAKRLQVGAGRWHLVGGLQRNKVRAAVAVFDVIQSLDTPAVARALGEEAAAAGRRLPVLIQVNAAGRAGQRGVLPEALPELARVVVGMPSLELLGLMTIAPAGAGAEAVRAHFAAVRALRDATARSLGVEMPHLSMGMSDDFSLAIEEGATLVRLGRALFGPRRSAPWREGS